jgi:predicted Holliday junction resolvase-like endonuclease
MDEKDIKEVKFVEVKSGKSKLSEHEFEIRQIEVEELIKFFKLSEYEEFFEESKNALPDPNDADFLALS